MVIIVYGLPGTGKTCFSEHLAKDIDAVHLNTDRIRHKINKQGQYDKASKMQVYEQMCSEMTRELRRSNDVIVDGTFYNYPKRNRFIERAKALNHKTVLIEIQAPENLIRKRLQKEREFSEADIKVYNSIKSKFEPDDENDLELQSGEDNIDEMIREAKNYIYG